MAYADFTYYQENYHGNKISTQTEFTAPSERASEYIDSVTFGSAALNSDTQIALKIKHCCCAVAEVIYVSEQNSGKLSEKVGNYSVTYTEKTNEALNHDIRRTVSIYLGDTGLLFRGV